MGKRSYFYKGQIENKNIDNYEKNKIIKDNIRI